MGLQPGRATNEPNNYFAFGKQASKNTDAATFFFTKHLDGTGYDVEPEVEAIKEGGGGQRVSLRYKTLVKGDGQFVTLARQSVGARLWDAVLGHDTVGSAAVASLGRHLAVPTTSQDYFTVEQRHADNLERQTNVVFTSLTLEGEAGKPWRYTSAFLGGGTLTLRDVASALTPVREVGRPVFFPGGSYVFDGAASYGADVTKFKVEVSRGVDDAIQTTGLSRDDVIALSLDVNVDATIKYTSREFYRKVQYNGGSVPLQDLAEGSLELVQYTSVGTAFGASAMSRVAVPALQWTDAKVNKLDPDGKTVYLDVVGADFVPANATHAIFAEHDNMDLTAY